MKKFLAIFLVVVNINIFSQELQEGKIFSSYHIGFLGGVNFSDMLGSSFLLESKTKISDNVNLKLSLGYSNIYKEEIIFISIQPLNYPEYITYTASANGQIRYAVFPISAGIEYYFSRGGTYPFIFAETGVNIYSSSLSRINGLIVGNYTSLYNEKDWSAAFRGAFGLGVSFKASSSVDIETRYAYQINNSIENTNQILVGIIF